VTTARIFATTRESHENNIGQPTVGAKTPSRSRDASLTPYRRPSISELTRQIGRRVTNRIAPVWNRGQVQATTAPCRSVARRSSAYAAPTTSVAPCSNVIMPLSGSSRAPA
jgi:hypothetical protein